MCMLLARDLRVDVVIVIGAILEVCMIEEGPRHIRGARDDARYNKPTGVVQCGDAVQHFVKVGVRHKVGVVITGHVQHENNAVALDA